MDVWSVVVFFTFASRLGEVDENFSFLGSNRKSENIR